MKISRLLFPTFVAAQFALNTFGQTTTNSDTDLETLKQQIQDLDQKVRILQRQRENDKDDEAAAATAAKAQPKLIAGANGFGFSSADSNFVATLHGLIQLDSREFYDNSGGRGSDGFLLRRARPIFTGTVFRDYDFNFTPDFGGSTVQIMDAYVNYRNRPELQVEVGKFKSPVGLEQLQSDQNLSFNERSLANDLVPNRDLGAELHGDLFQGVASYAAGLFDGSPDYSGTTTNADYDNDLAFAGRVFFQPFKTLDIAPLQGLGFGVGGSWEYDRATATTATGLTSGYTTDGQQKFFTYASGVYANGRHWRLSPQGYYYYGPFSLLGEYVISDQQVRNATTRADLQNTAWEISGGWVLTGESASYNGITPAHPFDPRKNQWGAWQVVGRYADLDVDGDAFSTFASAATSAKSAHAWSGGVNWYLNKNVRVDASFSHTTFIGGASGTVTRQPEEVFFTRVQLAF